MMWRKSCSRCRGDLVLDSDYHGPYVSCIQCGNVLNDRQHRALLLRATRVLPGGSLGAERSLVPTAAGGPDA
jgi:hypothetical protein